MKHTVHETDFLCRHKPLFSDFGQGVHRQCLSMLGDTAVAAWERSQQTWEHLLAVVTHGHGDVNGGKQSSWGTELAGDVSSDKSSAPNRVQII